MTNFKVYSSTKTRQWDTYSYQMFPTTYHGYQTFSELPIIPIKEGLATRGTPTMRESESFSARGPEKVLSVSLQQRPHTMYGRDFNLNNTVGGKNLSSSGKLTSLSLNQPKTNQVTNHIHQNYRRNIPEVQDKPDALQNATFKTTQHHVHECYDQGER